jgi:hypothetical protein
MATMGKPTVEMKVRPPRSKRAGKLIIQGVEIQRPAVAPNASIARIRRAAKIAVKQYAHDLSAEG